VGGLAAPVGDLVAPMGGLAAPVGDLVAPMEDLAAPMGDPPVKADANDACSIARDLAGGADEEPARAADEESTRAADSVACGSASSSDFDLDYYEALFSTG
jgi:hypothetical protein